MPWAMLIPLLLQYGLPFVDKIFTQWTANPNATVTQAEWDSLKTLAQNTALSQMKAALARAGIPETDPRAIALLAAVPQ